MLGPSLRVEKKLEYAPWGPYTECWLEFLAFFWLKSWFRILEIFIFGLKSQEK